MLVMKAIDVFDKINGFLLLWEFVGRVFFALNGIIDDICSNCLFTLNTCSGFFKGYGWTAERKVSSLSFPVAF